MTLEEFGELQLKEAQERAEREQQQAAAGKVNRRMTQLEADGDEDDEKLVNQVRCAGVLFKSNVQSNFLLLSLFFCRLPWRTEDGTIGKIASRKVQEIKWGKDSSLLTINHFSLNYLKMKSSV